MRERDRVEMQEEGQRGEGGRSGARHGDACFELLRAKSLSGRGEGVLRVFV